MQRIDERLRSPGVDRLFDAILTLQTVEECYRFFHDLLTIGEIQSFAQRFEAACMLADGRTYDEVVKKTGMSTATVSRIKRFLHYGADGYRLAIARLNAVSRTALDPREE
ncbi:MAG: YerC/YecD family TrpR-related protein [Bacillota bacterium]